MRRLFLLTALIFYPGCKLVKSPEERSTSLASVTPEALTEIKGLYQQNDLATEDTTLFNYNSTIVELGSEQLMSCWIANRKEATSTGKILCSEKTSTGTWSTPRVVVETASKSAPSNKQTSSSPVLFKDQEGTVWLFYDVDEKDKVAIAFKVSKDNGQTFSAESKLNGDFANLRSKPIQLSSGRFMIPLFKNMPKSSGYIVMLSPDQGIVRDTKTIAIPGMDHRTPALTLKEDEDGVNKVFAFLSDEKAKNVIVSEYDFIAGSFSPVKNTNIPNPKSTVDTVTTENNQILMIYNDSSTGNSPLSLGVSDDGITFKKIWDFETAAGDFSSPSFIRDEVGHYHLTYTQNQKTIRYVTFDSIWLSLKLRAK